MHDSLEGVQREWAARVVAEYRSAALSAEYLHWLIRLGLSPDTLEDCHRTVAEELRHAELAREVYLAAGGSAAPNALEESSLRFGARDDLPLLLQAASVCARMFCCGETVALPLFQAMRANAQHPLVQTTLDEIIRDEAKHRAFGWSTLEELLERDPAGLRATLRPRIQGYTQELLRGYRKLSPTSALEKSWGLLQAEQYAEITQQCVETQILPRFERLFGPLEAPQGEL